MGKKYNKLVRDNIPNIIESKGNIALTNILNNSQYLDELNKKLQEEMYEYLEDENIEELADIVEVIYAILDYKGVKLNDFEKIRLDKVKERGAFKNKIFLMDVIEK